MSPLNRREFVRRTGAFAAAGLALPSAGLAERPGPSYAQDYPDMLLASLAKQLNALAEKWDVERASLRTPADIESRNRFVRDTVRKMIHGFPERNPMRAVVVRSQEHEGYRVENVMFESRPDFWVTGNLYVPTTGTGPFPAVISPCGHYMLARMQPDYQAVYLNLVKNGFVVLGYDPVGQGERRQYWDPQTRRADIDDPVYEHSMPGQVLLLMGEDLTHYRVWDGMRAIDYLLTRPEVDGKKIGCAGHAGGGTLTMFISALDERVQCAVINEGGTRHRWPIHIRPGDSFGPSDVEQNIFPSAVHGIDMCDLHVAVAPRPLLVLIEDYSSAFDQAARHIRQRYQQLGVAEKFETLDANDPHAYTSKLRLATTNWFSRWFLNRPGPAVEADFQTVAPEKLYCTPNGSVRYARQGQTVFTLMAKHGAALPPPRTEPARPDEIRALLRIENGPPTPLASRQLVITPRRGYRVEKVEFLSAPGIYIPAWVFLPERKASGRAVLYANEAGKEHDGMEFGVLEQLARAGRIVVSIDVRGVGETAPPHHQDLTGSPYEHLFSVETGAAYLAWYMDRDLFGMRVQDLIRSVDYTLSRPDTDRSGVDVIGKGAGALWALYAAALDTRIRSVVAERGLISYRSLTATDRYLHTAGVFVRDVLKSFDLPHVAAAIADRRLVLLSPVDPMKEADVPAAEQAYEFTRQAYARAGAAGRFRITADRADLSAAEQYVHLLEERNS